MAEANTLVTEEMRQRRNVWSEPESSPPIALSDIRKWAIAVYWPEKPPPLYWDETYAKTTRYGGIVAPEDFNPFAWPLEQPAWRLAMQPSRGPGQRGMNGGQKDVFGVRMRPGDVITRCSALVDWNEKVGRLGLTLYSFTEWRWTNQRGELVKTSTFTSIRY